MTLQSYQPGNWMRDGHESVDPGPRIETKLVFASAMTRFSSSQYGVAAEGLVPAVWIQSRPYQRANAATAKRPSRPRMSGQGPRLVVGGAGDSRGEIWLGVGAAGIALPPTICSTARISRSTWTLKSRPDSTSTALR